MKLDVNLCKQSSSNDLPDKTQNKMFCSLCYVARTNVDDRASDGFGRCNDNVVVLGHLERVQALLSSRLVQNSDIDSVRDGIVDEFTEDKPISAFFKNLHGISGDRESCANVWIVLEDL